MWVVNINEYVNYYKYVNYYIFWTLFFTGSMERIVLICLQKEIVTGGFFLTSEVCPNQLLIEIWKPLHELLAQLSSKWFSLKTNSNFS